MKRWVMLLLALPLLLRAEEEKLQNQLADSGSYQSRGETMRRKSSSPCREINPSAWGCPGNEGIFLKADFLYWRASEDDLMYAQVSEDSVNTSGYASNANFRTSRGVLVNMKTNWEPAFRVGTGWNTNYDSWDVGIVYTWYKNRSREQVSSTVTGPVGGIPASWTVVAASDTVAGTSAKAVWKLRLDEGSLELGRAFYTSKSFSTRPFLGVKIDRLYRKTKFQYEGTTSGAIQKYINLNRFLGYGPQMGIGMDFHLPYGLSVMGKMGSTLFFGEGKQKMQTLEDNFIVGNARARPYWKMIPQLQVSTGMSWGMCTCNETCYYEFSVAWEGLCFWGVPRNMPPNPGAFMFIAKEQTLFLNGLTLNAKVDF